MEPTSEIVLYQPNELIKIEVRMQDETVWLTQSQMSQLFQATPQNITMHIRNLYKEGELEQQTTCKEFLHVQIEGTRQVQRLQKFYNLDVIISVGYRVKSQAGTRFRQWANKVLKDYLLRGYAVNSRLTQLEQRITKTEEQISFFIRTSLPPIEGLFYEGQVYDAYEFIVKLIESAKRRIVIIDNYVDDSVLTLLDKRADGVNADIYTWKINQQLQLDISRHDAQYPAIPVHQLRKAHDRFLIIDDDLYHVGASVKDLGTKWTAIMKMNNTSADEILAHI